MRADLIRPLSDLLAGHAAERGDRVAFGDAAGELTYRELDHRTRCLAADLGPEPGEPIAVLLGNRVAAVEATLATVLAGGVSVPLNPNSGESDLAHVLADSGATTVITDHAHRARLDRVATAARVVDVDAWHPSGAGAGPFDEESTMDRAALLLYTSGTTGNPKGVRYSLRSSLWMAAACHAPILGLSDRDVVVWPLPLFHGLGQNLAVFGVVAVGATARLLPGFGVDDVLTALRDHRATVLAGVPTTYHHLLAGADRTAFPELRLGFVAGSASGADLGGRFEAAFGVPLVDQYGCTEAAAITTNWPTGRRVPGSAGLAVPGVGVRLVDPDTGHDVAAGVEGEVWVSGPNLMLGYHNQPEATAEVLRDGWYRTGDLARRDANGFVTITGRLRELIIRGGENIHPVEVEQVLREFPGVADAAVAGRPDPVLGEVPVAYVVPEESGVDAAALLATCRERLAYHKVPVAVYRVDAIPRTPSGKITRHRLGDLPATLLADRPDDAGTPAPGPTAGTVSGDDLDAVLDVVLAEVRAATGATGVDQDRPFVELGLGSMAAVALASRVFAATGVPLPATAVFDNPTPASLARRIVERATGAPAAGSGSGSGSGGRGGRLRDRDTEPIAIVGMACRYPGGVGSPEDLWRLLVDGGDAIGPFPTDRGWDLANLHHPDPDHPGTTYTREGGFLDDAAGFDNAFFGISPKEATAMDPQQRLALELSWEVFERAGIDPGSLAGTATGVFLGVNGGDYQRLGHGLPEYEAHLGFATSASVLSGRVAYVHGLHGPAITVDTACSASLVAIHLACRSLRSGESTLAVAGGVTVQSTPDAVVTFARQRGLAADSRCKSFSADADGTAFGEGIGVLLLQRLGDARRQGRPVLALLRGSAVNSDGASNGLTAPNGLAQQQVIRRAVADAGLTTADIDLVEAHGTGTTLGDPIEAGALLATYGADRETPAWLGAVKSNLGHTQAAAGVAGVIKCVLALRHGLMPRTLHVSEPTRYADWSSGGLALLTEARPWPAADRPRRAGISAFAISGTNAHVIVEEPPHRPPTPPREPADPPVVPVLVSARSRDALRGQARGLIEVDAPPLDIAHSLVTTRAALPYRAVVVAADRDDLRRGLTDLAERGGGDLAAAGRRVAFAFTGQGAQRPGMGGGLYRAHPVFAEAFDEVAAHFAAPLPEILSGAVDPDLVTRTDHAQPALFAVEVALFRLLAHWGVHPDHLVGHSIGELAAAHVAGVFTLADAATLVTARGRLLARPTRPGAMVALRLSAADAVELLVGYESDVDIAAVNGPTAVVISGAEPAVSAVADRARAAGVKATRLAVSTAFHSPLVDEVLAEFAETAKTIAYRSPAVPMVSTVTGTADAPWTDPDYWVRQIRSTVRFGPAVAALRAAGVDTVVELGPDAALTAAVHETMTGADHLALALLRAGQPEPETLVTGLGRLHNRGVPVDWYRFFAGSGARTVELPTYAFEHRRFWIDRAPSPRPVVEQAPPEPERDLRALATDEERLIALVEMITAAAAGVLGHRDAAAIDPDAPIDGLGFDSLAAVELRNELVARTGLDLRATLVFEHPTFAVLADDLLTRLDAESADRVDFAGEVWLDDDIVPAAEVVTASVEPRDILLTGVTGFLGAYLLRELVRTTRATVHCLVRAEDAAAGLRRVQENLDWYGLGAEVDPARLVVVPGDLAEPLLGLSPEEFDALARRVDVVYHAAAHVNGLYPYSALRAANVSGTREVLRLAARHRTVPVHHVSTTGVFSAVRDTGRPLSTSDQTGPPEELWSGYRQSKWVAEQLVGLARDRGLPVSVHRVDEISGDTATGACQRHDFVWLAIKGLLQAGAVPSGCKGRFHLVPVDHVSAAVVALAHQPPGTYHHGNRQHLGFDDMVDCLRRLGHHLTELDWDSWVERVAADRDNAMNPMLAAFDATIHTADNAYVTVDLTDTEAALADGGPVCPPMTEELFARYVDWFTRVGYFPAPVPRAAVERVRGDVHIRPAVPGDLDPLARICLNSFNEANAALGLPPEWDGIDQAKAVIRERLTAPRCRSLVAVDGAGAVLGSNFVLPGDEVATWGPLSVAPHAQGRGVGKHLMAATFDAIADTGRTGAHVVQTTANLAVYRLYTSMGCVARDDLVVLRGRVTDPDAVGDFTVRPMRPADLAACAEIHRTVNGYARDSEIALAARGGFGGVDPHVVTGPDGVVVGYTTGLTFMGHLTCLTEPAARALHSVLSGSMTDTPLIRVMARLNPELLTWALTTGDVTISRHDTVISHGDYRQPRTGVYCPAQSH
ncbi:type I polyketide synthase [Actinokineospora auranticolor]|uniref:Thioester reductase-like protein n=1 Tax=Actinokineospora auranticolor TaxID=155976 RepID=A0A2S6GPE3_9PSEU|nr:type I polyketide synthase [Actinokineospora auranticolor]PPK67089.1 thioester reductase-like protein [Actinokineospora auranticolor]